MLAWFLSLSLSLQASIPTREHAETDLLRPRVHRPSRPRCAVSQKYKWKRTTRGAAASTSGATQRRAGRFQWGHVIARTSGRTAADQSASLSTCAGAEWASELTVRTTAISFSLPGFARLTVHRSRRLLNPTLFARYITYFVIAHFVPR